MIVNTHQFLGPLVLKFGILAFLQEALNSSVGFFFSIGFLPRCLLKCRFLSPIQFGMGQDTAFLRDTRGGLGPPWSRRASTSAPWSSMEEAPWRPRTVAALGLGVEPSECCFTG